jgi:hypothetical protein
MSERESSRLRWLERITDKVAVEIAGSVAVLLLFLIMLPSILDRMYNDTQVYCLLAMLGGIIIFLGVSMILYSVSKFRERERKSWSKTIKELGVSNRDISSETSARTREQIREAASLMEGEQNE